MSKDMDFWLQFFNHRTQGFAADRRSHDAIEDSVRRGVGDENINPGREEVPFVFEGLSAGEREGPIHKLGLPGAAVEVNAVDGDALVFEVGPMSESFSGVLGLPFEAELVIASDDELVPEGKASEPVVEVFKLIQGSRVGEVTGVNKDVPRGHDEVSVTSMSVTCHN